MDAALMWAPLAGWLAHQHPELRLRLIAVDAPGMRFEVGVGMRKQDADLRAAINAALERLGPAKVSAIVDRYVVQVGTTSVAAAEASAPTTRPAADAGGAGPPEVAAHSADSLASGRQLFDRCTPCHGLRVQGGGIVPLLKQFKGTDDDFVKTVLSGRPGTPMRSWRRLLDEKQIRDIRAARPQFPAAGQ